MKRYLLSFIAIFCALVFGAFTKLYVLTDFKLLQDPTAANIVKNPEKWAVQGQLYGRCDELQNDIACVIQLNAATQAAYFHNDGDNDILNTFDYANAQSSKKNYLIIAEGTGAGSDRIITSITPYRWDANANGPTGAYVTTSLGADLAYKNARD